VTSINAGQRIAIGDLHDARKQLSTARRSTADPDLQDAADAALHDAQGEHDRAVLQMWLAQRPHEATS
jgi:hypothetical protein